jgi:ABC-type sugar transport system ATPase subunit
MVDGGVAVPPLAGGRPLLSVRGLTVRYGATTALDAVDLDVQPGEVHAVVGENGAGKSTLLRVVAGAVAAQAGTVALRGRLPVAWVPQETELPPDLTAADWIFLGAEQRGTFRLLRREAMRQAAAHSLAAIGCRVAPTARLGDCTAPQRKQIQLARALREQAGVLLLDEPTAVLGEAETRSLFAAVRAERTRGAGILYVSHRLEEVLALADRATVLRDGRRVSTDAVADIDVATLVRRMVGREISVVERRGGTPGDCVARLFNVDVAHVRDASFVVREGEVVGLAGLVGAGRSEILDVIAGLRAPSAGHIERRARPFLVPEDRALKGLVFTMNVRENVCLPADGAWLSLGRERSQVREWLRKLAIQTRDTETPVTQLSGGNQQKVILARVLRHAPRLLLLDEPTAGVDVGAKAEIHVIVRQMAESGAAILLASSDLPELLTVCDRIVCLYAGNIVADVAAAETNEEKLAAWITGVGRDPNDGRQGGSSLLPPVRLLS